MAISAAYTGNQTVGTTEWSLTSDSSSIGAISTNAWVQIDIDMSALAAGDVYEVKVYNKAVSGGTQRTCRVYTFAGAQGEPHVSILPGVLGFGWEVSGKKLAGTDRAWDWTIWTIT